MPNYTFSTAIPAAGNNPSNDQGPMQVNNLSTNNLIAEDHYSFNDNNGGLHKWARLNNQDPPLSAARAAKMGTIWTQESNSNSELFYIPDAVNVGHVYQLTRTNDANYGTFAAQNPGWTFLPGGLLLQYGAAITNNAGNVSVTFPITFSTALYNVQLTVQNSQTTVTPIILSNSGITIQLGVAVAKSVSWMVIGK